MTEYCDKFGNPYWILGFVGSPKETSEVYRHLVAIDGISVTILTIKPRQGQLEQYLSATTYEKDKAAYLRLGWQNR